MNRQITKYSGIGGQAVLEGVMMRNRDKYAVAVRKEDGGIAVHVDGFKGAAGGQRVRRIPLLRGIFVFLDSLSLGMRAINISAAYFDDEETSKKEKSGKRQVRSTSTSHGDDALSAVVTVVSFGLALALFMFLPYFLASLIRDHLPVNGEGFLSVLEGLLRIAIFVIYVLLISLMKDIRRLFSYHGAEHKCINCIESGKALTVENARGSSRLHRRCGSSFLLFVMLVSIVLFFFIRADSLPVRLLIRVLLIPVIAGISYELIQLAGRTDNILIRALSAPGLWMQKLTTKEPDDSMIEVAISAVESVFDWRQYLHDAFGIDVPPEEKPEDQLPEIEDPEPVFPEAPEEVPAEISEQIYAEVQVPLAAEEPVFAEPQIFSGEPVMPEEPVYFEEPVLPAEPVFPEEPDPILPEDPIS